MASSLYEKGLQAILEAMKMEPTEMSRNRMKQVAEQWMAHAEALKRPITSSAASNMMVVVHGEAPQRFEGSAMELGLQAKY